MLVEVTPDSGFLAFVVVALYTAADIELYPVPNTKSTTAPVPIPIPLGCAPAMLLMLAAVHTPANMPQPIDAPNEAPFSYAVIPV